MGPYDLGNTKSIQGTWQILYKLDVILRWGENEYRAWFEAEVMTKWTKNPILRSLKRGEKA